MSQKAKKPSSWRNVGIAIVVAVAISLVIAWQYEHNVSVYNSYKAPLSVDNLSFGAITAEATNENCYPGVCYEIKGQVTNRGNQAHSASFVVEFYNGATFIHKTAAVTVQALEPGTGKSFELHDRSNFGGLSAYTSIKPRVFSIDGKTFDTAEHCTRKVSLWGYSQTCFSGF